MFSLRTIAATLAAICALAVLVSLGNWQMRRLAWKEDLIAKVAERMVSAPVDLTEATSAEFNRTDFLDENEYRPVVVSGTFVPDTTIRTYTALSDPNGPLQGPGYWLLTILRLPGGQGLFINRGFIPFDIDEPLPPAPNGIVSVSGIVRAPETGNFMTPEPEFEKRIWYARNIAQIADQLSVGSDVLPYFLDADASMTPEGGLPQAGETRTSFPNSHLQYAITWYGLAAALVCVFGVYVFSNRSGTSA